MIANKVIPIHSQESLFEELVTEHGEALMQLAYTYVKNRQVAEDIVQDVFLKAFEKVEDYRGDASYKTYLFRMTINRSYDYLRSWSYKNTLLSNKIAMVFQSDRLTEAEVMQKNENDLIGNEIMSLPPKYREVLILYYYQEFRIEDIGELLNCSPNTVKTRLRRARERLKTKLEGKGGLYNG